MINIIVSQDKFIDDIARNIDGVTIATVRAVMKTAENLMFNYLQSTTPYNSMTVKPFKGFSITGEYVPEREFKTFKNWECKARIKIKPKVSKYYKSKFI